MRLAVTALLALGCGRLGFDPAATATDAAATDTGPAPIEPPSFSAPTPVTELGDIDYRDPDISDDGLELAVAVLASDGRVVLFSTAREDTAASWPAPVEIETLGALDGSTDPELSPDRLILGFGGGIGDRTQLFETRRGAVTDLWPEAAAIADLTFELDAFGFSRTADDLCGLFALGDGGGAAATDIVESCRPEPSAPWGPPRPVVELNSAVFDGNPNLSADGLRVLFDSTRDSGGEGRRIYFAARATRDAPFSEPVKVDLAGEASDPTITGDRQLLLFTSVRSGQRRLYQATRL